MIKDVFASIGAAARKLVTNFPAVLIAFLLYAALWLAGYFFVTTREATQLQVVLSLIVLPLFALIVFFALQAIGLSYVRIGVGAGYLLKRALQDFWKLLVVSLPLIFLAWVLWKLFGYLDHKFVATAKPGRPGLELGLTVLRWLCFYFVLPLWAIHLWMTAIREGLAPAFKGIGRSLLAAFSLRSVLIYVIVAAVFGALAYFIAFTETHVQNEWGELWLVGIRFGLALLLPFVGWMLALGAMAEMTARRALSELEV